MGANENEGVRLRQDEVELRMLADRERVPGIRALAADMAMRQDYDLDAIDDLRLVVDEVFAILLVEATPETIVTARLLISPDRIEIGASVPLPGTAEPAGQPMSARILRILSDSFDCVTNGSEADRTLAVHFVRSSRRAASA